MHLVTTAVTLCCVARLCITGDAGITQQYLDMRYKEFKADAREMLLEYQTLKSYTRDSHHVDQDRLLSRYKRQGGNSTGSSGSWWDQVGGWVDKGLDTFNGWMDKVDIDKIKKGVDLGIQIGKFFMSRAQAKEAARKWEAGQRIKLEELCDAICVTEWSYWSLCSQRCGGGVTSRTRAHVLPGKCKSINGFVCRHGKVESKHCNTGCGNGGSPKQGGGCTCTLGFTGHCCSNGVKCGYPGKPKNGKVELSGEGTFPVPYGAVATFSCNTGYATEGHTETTVCEVKNSKGSWTNPAPECKRVTCETPQSPPNGRLLNMQSTFLLGDEAMFICNEGFERWGPERRQCVKFDGVQGRWTAFTPLCSPMKCPAPDTPNYAERNGTNFNVRGRITYSCARGFQLHGTRTRTCMPTGHWSGNMPECKVMTCEPPEILSHASIRGKRETYTFGRKVIYSCEPGYELVGPSVLQCVEDPIFGTLGTGGMWNGSAPVCKATICGNPGTPSNGSKDGSLYYFPHDVTFICYAGYVLQGSVTISCGRDAKWSSPIPKCQACPSNTHKATADAKGACIPCPENMHTVTVASTSPLQCICNQGYTGPPGGPCTEITCPVLAAPADGDKTDCGNKLGNSCEFTCQPGYIIERGSSKRTCQTDGEWTGTDPVCRACPEDTFQHDMRSCLPCPRHSGTKDTTANINTGCECDHGYAGPKGGPCRDIDECQANGGQGPCQDLCENLPGGYKCGCSIPGYVIDNEDPHTCIVEQTCRNLTRKDAPAHGGLVCHWYKGQNSQQCSVRCNRGYEFPTRTNNYESCGPTSDYKWSHVERGEIIEPCLEEFFEDFRLEADSFYFVQACANLTEAEKEQVKRDFAKTLTEEGVCMKRATKVCTMANVGIICGRTTRRKRGVIEEIDEVDFKFDISAIKFKDKPKDCSEICALLRIPAYRCQALCIPVYKRFLRAAVLFSKTQLTKLFQDKTKTRFVSVKRHFEPIDNGLKTSDVKTDCKPGMKKADDICVPCVAGTFLNSRTNECEKCARRTYQPNNMQTSCLPCPIGSISIRLGSKSCMTCPNGWWGDSCRNHCGPCVNGQCDNKTGQCICGSGWEGLKCDQDINSCSPDSCYPGVRCFDIRPPGIGYRCGPCPPGMAGDGANCAAPS